MDQENVVFICDNLLFILFAPRVYCSNESGGQQCRPPSKGCMDRYVRASL